MNRPPLSVLRLRSQVKTFSNAHKKFLPVQQCAFCSCASFLPRCSESVHITDHFTFKTCVRSNFRTVSSVIFIFSNISSSHERISCLSNSPSCKAKKRNVWYCGKEQRPLQWTNRQFWKISDLIQMPSKIWDVIPDFHSGVHIDHWASASSQKASLQAWTCSLVKLDDFPQLLPQKSG